MISVQPHAEQAIRVAFDVTPAINGRTGIARYVNELAAALERQQVILRRYAIGRAVLPPPPGTRHLPVPARLIAPVWSAVGHPGIERFVESADLVHATGLRVPPTRLPLVVTVHDLAAIQHPDLHPRQHTQLLQGVLAALDRAAAVIAVSRATADDLVAWGVEEERIVVAHNGFRPLPTPIRQPAAVARPRTFLLTVGETAPRKRYDILLETLVRLPPEIDLVMAGPAAADEDRLNSLASKFGIADRVHRLGAVSDAVLADLFSCASALCFPSVAEGFGLPILEAMASGLPVVARSLPITREIAGEAAIYVDGDDPEAWAQAILTVVGDHASAARLGQAGVRRAAEFTWEQSARRTIHAYQMALESGS